MTVTASRVATRFTMLLARLEPRPSEVTQARVRVGLIRQRLKREFDISKVELVGSHLKETALRGTSDVDVFAVLRREQLRWGGSDVRSDTLLNWIRDDLAERFPHTTVGRDGLAVRVHFGRGEHGVDVVPAAYEGPLSNGMPLYRIPDGTGGWLRTSPAAHQAYFRTMNIRAGGKLSRLVRLLKHWRESRTPALPLSSFHVELVLASEGVAAAIAGYSTLLTVALNVLASRKGAALRDPLQVSGPVPATATATQRARLAATLETSAHHATLARSAERAGNLAEALYRWRLVFNDAFPQ